MSLEVVRGEDCQGEQEARNWLAKFLGSFWAYAVPDAQIREWERKAVEILNAPFDENVNDSKIPH